jgi:hypothetical protein
MHARPDLRPRWDEMRQACATHSCCLAGSSTARLPRPVFLSGLDPKAHVLAVYASKCAVARAPRKTRFRLVASLCRVGLATHWVHVAGFRSCHDHPPHRSLAWRTRSEQEAAKTREVQREEKRRAKPLERNEGPRRNGARRTVIAASCRMPQPSTRSTPPPRRSWPPLAPARTRARPAWGPALDHGRSSASSERARGPGRGGQRPASSSSLSG